MKVRDLLHRHQEWTQNTWARDLDGNEVGADSPYAVRWNLSGAINYCYFLTVPEEVKTDAYKESLAKKMHQIIDIIGTPDVWVWESSPERTFGEIKSIIDRVDI